MDAVLRTGLDWFAEETRSSPHLARVNKALIALRDKLDRLPSDLFFLESPDEPYALLDILSVLGTEAMAWFADPKKAIERKLLAPQVEEILEKAVELRALLAKASQHSEPAGLRPLPLGTIRRSMESRGESLPDRL